MDFSLKKMEKICLPAPGIRAARGGLFISGQNW
jgi:hypothetical protein